MKVQGTVKRTQTVEGTISKKELLALVRESLHIPPEAGARFYAYAPPSIGFHQQLISSGQLHTPEPIVDISDTSPLRFTITWSLPVGENEQG